MKAIHLSTALLFFTVSAVAQKKFLNRPVSPLEDNFFILKDKRPIMRINDSILYEINRQLQNSMPCYVPDVSSIAAMPTKRTVIPNQYIPNPYFKYNSPLEDPK